MIHVISCGHKIRVFFASREGRDGREGPSRNPRAVLGVRCVLGVMRTAISYPFVSCKMFSQEQTEKTGSHFSFALLRVPSR